MIRKLRLKFICVNMVIVTLMLTAIFGMVYHLTRQGLETQSEAMLQSVASDAFHPNRPGSPPQEVHLPFSFWSWMETAVSPPPAAGTMT